MRHARPIGYLVVFALLTACSADSVEAEAPPITAEQAMAEREQLIKRMEQYSAEMEQAEAETPPARTYYMGREVAQTMHWFHADWLTRTEREREEGSALLMENLPLEPGMIVCDLGAGNGYYTLKISDALGEKGTVIAQELQPEMLELLQERAEEHEAHDNIVYWVGTLINPMLPPESCDLIILVDVYHEFSHPEHMLRRIREALKPDGRLVLVEFRAEDETVPIRPEHKMSKAQVHLELEANGFKVVEEFDELPWQHVIYFERDDGWEFVEPGTRFPGELETADPPRPSRDAD